MTRVTIGDDPSWTFEAEHVDNVRWNGWACPWFTEAEGRKIAAVTQAEYDRDPDQMQEIVLVHDNAVPSERFTLEAPHEDQEPYFVDSMVFNGVMVYAIGAANWTWEEVHDVRIEDTLEYKLAQATGTDLEDWYES